MVIQSQFPSSERFFVKLSCNTGLLTYDELPNLLQSCELPVVVCSEGKLVISGFCSVLRHIVHTAQRGVECLDDCDLANCLKNLLGLRHNCLRACAEVSEWTLYTEVTLPQLVERLVNNSDIIGPDPPAELLQLENQLAKLPVEPNWHRNQKQSKTGLSSAAPVAAKESVVENRRNEDSFSEDLRRGKCQNVLEGFDNLLIANSAEEICQRPFVEGSNVQLTDLVLFICIRLLFGIEDTEQWCTHLPRLVSWRQRMAAIPAVNNAVISAGLFECVARSVAQGRVISHPSPLFTAYISDKAATSVEDKHGFSCTSDGRKSTSESVLPEPTADDQSCIQNTEKTKFRASQGLVDAGIAKVTKTGLLLEVSPLGNGSCLQLPWEQYPSWVVPYGLGGVPDRRATRKLQQLENVAAAVEQLVSERFTDSEADVIVDFCSGSGHVGILLAYLYSHCKVILVENKEESVRRATKRIACSGVNNITVVQCNVGRFHAPFNIGICLHGCGVATDLVLAKCVAASASFVVSPCCYGAVHNVHSVTYPRSDVFQTAGVEYREYLAVGHAADQTESTIAKYGQGRTCMAVVDSDRCLSAKQFGYSTQLFVMTPPTCSPKNHILIGQPASSQHMQSSGIQSRF